MSNSIETKHNIFESEVCLSTNGNQIINLTRKSLLEKGYIVANHLNNISGNINLIKSFKTNEVLQAILTDDQIKKLAEGTIEFMPDSETGEIISTLRDSTSKHITNQLRLKKITDKKEIQNSLNNYAIQKKMTSIISELNSVKSLTEKLLEGQEDDRIALYNSGKEQYFTALTIEDNSLRIECLTNALKSINDGKNQLFLSMENNIKDIISLSSKRRNMIFEKITPEEINSKVENIYHNLSLIIESTMLQSAVFYELKEFKTIHFILKEFSQTLGSVFNEDVCYKLSSNSEKINSDYWIENIPETQMKLNDLAKSMSLVMDSIKLNKKHTTFIGRFFNSNE